MEHLVSPIDPSKRTANFIAVKPKAQNPFYVQRHEDLEKSMAVLGPGQVVINLLEDISISDKDGISPYAYDDLGTQPISTQAFSAGVSIFSGQTNSEN